MTEKNYSWYDIAFNFIEVCFSCQSQNIKHEIVDNSTRNTRSICKDCGSEDTGSVPPEEVL